MRWIVTLSLIIGLLSFAQTNSAEVRYYTTQTYCSPGGTALKMQIHSPRGKTNINAAVIYIHGGGWNSGDRTMGFERRRMKALDSTGLTVVTLDYRLAPEYKFPAQIHDVKCAIKYIRKNAAKYNIDPNRIALMGDSAGGHLAALAGLTQAEDGLEGSTFPEVSTEVKAIVGFYGAYDLVNVEPSLLQHAIPPAISSSHDRYIHSPIIYVDEDDPPVLLIHGKEDKFVDVAQSVKLAMILKDKGHQPLLLVVENGGHGLVPRGGTPTPDNDVVDKLMIAFLTDALK